MALGRCVSVVEANKEHERQAEAHEEETSKEVAQDVVDQWLKEEEIEELEEEDQWLSEE